MSENNEVKLNYPLNWTYTLITKNPEKMEQICKNILLDKSYQIKISRSSSKKAFTSVHLKLIVETETERLAIFDKLRLEKSILHIL